MELRSSGVLSQQAVNALDVSTLAPRTTQTFRNAPVFLAPASTKTAGRESDQDLWISALDALIAGETG
jgi:hypothetical protein